MPVTPRPRAIQSLHNATADRCVDILQHENGLYSFKEFRRDIEDQGRWYSAGAESTPIFVSVEAAVVAAIGAVPWLAAQRAR